MGDEWRTMMLALDVDPMGGGDWRWRWYDHDSDRTLADGVEGDVVAAWRAATTHHVKSSNELLWSLDDRAEAAEQRAEAWRWFAQEVASDMHPIGADPLGDITTDFLPVLLDITRRAAQQQGADCARAEAAEQRAESAERRLRITAALIIEAIGSVGPEDAEDAARRLWDVSEERDALRARAEDAEQRAEAAEVELAQARADARTLACQWRAVDDTEDLQFFGACWHEAHAGRSEGDLGRDPTMADLVAALRRAIGGVQ